MFKIKIFLILTVFSFSINVFSQLKSNNLLNTILNKKEIEFKSQINFTKAKSFFVLKKWDSTLVYSMKQLNSNKNKELDDYCHYPALLSLIKDVSMSYANQLYEVSKLRHTR